MNPHHLSLGRLQHAVEAFGRELDQTGKETENETGNKTGFSKTRQNKTSHEGESAQTEASPIYVDISIVFQTCEKCRSNTLTCKP